MPAESETISCSNPWCTLYEIALSLYREANTFLIETRISSMPLMLRYVSCWPAKEASGKSSAVADERTANVTDAPYFSANL